MSAPRKMSDHQRAAHLLLPMVASVLKEMTADATYAEAEAKRARASKDAESDWSELALKARARAEGASRIAEMLQAVARG